MERHVLVPGFVIEKAHASQVDDACEIAKLAWARVHDSFRKIMGEEMHAVLCADWEENKEQNK